MENPQSYGFNSLVYIFAAFVLMVLLVRLVIFINDFSAELKRVNTEIGRTTGNERMHYVRKRRRLWLSIIPFVKY